MCQSYTFRSFVQKNDPFLALDGLNVALQCNVLHNLYPHSAIFVLN